MSNNIQLRSISPRTDNDSTFVDVDNGGVHNYGYAASSDQLEMGSRAEEPPPNNSNWIMKKKHPEDVENNPEYDDITNDASVYADNNDVNTHGSCMAFIINSQTQMEHFFEAHGKTIGRVVLALFILAYAGYFAYAMYYEFGDEGSIVLLVITSLVIFWAVVKVIANTCGNAIYTTCIQGPMNFINRNFTVFKVIFILLVVGGVVVFIVLEVALDQPRNLVSLSGIFVYVFLLFIFSYNPSKVEWRPVLWGLGLQFALALLVLKTQVGLDAFQWLGDAVSTFLEFSDDGAIFVFGETYEDHFFAFKVLPVVVFFSTVISVLYYMGVMQVVISKIAWVMQNTLGTSAPESVNAAGNIFIGQTEAPLLIRPMLPNMTNSEIHAVMVGGFATIAGSVMATYILFGVPPNHLITASVMAAPCALAMSKLNYPEEDKAQVKRSVTQGMEDSPQRNAIEAASAGAAASVKVCANIAANLIAFIALLAFINALLEWCGARVGLAPPDYPPLSFQLICSYLLWPLAFLMGVDTDDCRKVAELVGFKTFLNEFVAFTELGTLIDNRATWDRYNGTWTKINDDIYLKDLNVTLVGGIMSDRSIVISTYALCGFANISSIGMVMGALGAMAPGKRSDIARMALRAMIVGNIVSMMNACTAGLLYSDEDAVVPTMRLRR